jgi:hypothetical protein
VTFVQPLLKPSSTMRQDIIHTFQHHLYCPNPSPQLDLTSFLRPSQNIIHLTPIYIPFPALRNVLALSPYEPASPPLDNISIASTNDPKPPYPAYQSATAHTQPARPASQKSPSSPAPPCIISLHLSFPVRPLSAGLPLCCAWIGTSYYTYQPQPINLLAKPCSPLNS